MKTKPVRQRLNLFSLTLLTLTLYCSCSKDDNNEESEKSDIRYELPMPKGGNSLVINHYTEDSYGINYSVEWDKDKKSQRWSCYQLDSKRRASKTTRYRSNTNQYPFDPLLPTKDYLSQDCIYGSGFEHGHICPSADRLYSEEANYQTFFLTNMQPQYHAFNSAEESPWYRLEAQVRSWASLGYCEELYVVKGGTIEDNQILTNKDGTPMLVKGEMRVPKYFFVAVLMKTSVGFTAAGFWMEHESSYERTTPLRDFAVNIHKLEELTGIDFFYNLPDDIEEHVETLPIENVKRAWGL